MHPTLLTVLDKGWPFAASLLTGAIWVGSIQSDVSSLKASHMSAVTDHDTITRIEQKVDDHKAELDDIKNTLHRIEQSR